jgi:hypothetical protein
LECKKKVTSKQYWIFYFILPSNRKQNGKERQKEWRGGYCVKSTREF